MAASPAPPARLEPWWGLYLVSGGACIAVLRDKGAAESMVAGSTGVEIKPTRIIYEVMAEAEKK